MLEGKKIVLGVTGSIAAYKACLLVRELIKAGAEVQVILTPAGREFVQPVTFSTLTHKPVVCDFFSANDGTWHSHVDLGIWADAMLIAPCTASTIGKMAAGIADNMLVTTYLAMKAPVFIAPAMDLDMYAHPATQSNLLTLQQRGVEVIDSASGYLASGLEGKGRMAEPQDIVAHLDRYFQQSASLSGKKILITAGPTYERIDPVRFIGNYSSGKMGFAIAEECCRRGAEVTLIAGPVALKCSTDKITRIDVESCRQMYDAATSHFADADVAILAAAVADFRPETEASTKIKREGRKAMELTLVANPDIAATLGGMKREQQRLVVFALETNNEMDNAHKKMQSKHADMVVMNSLRNADTCFGSDNNQIAIVTAAGTTQFEKKTKPQVASDIVDAVASIIYK